MQYTAYGMSLTLDDDDRLILTYGLCKETEEEAEQENSKGEE